MNGVVKNVGRGLLREVVENMSEIKRFLAYRHDMNNRETHNELQKNDESEPQFEGVVFSDGTVALRWLAPLRSTSIWPDIETALGVHGHPEYGTDIIWFDCEPPEEWIRQCEAAGVHHSDL